MWKTDPPFIAILVRLVGVIFNCDVYQSVGLFVLFCTLAAPASGQTSVVTQHNDNARTGQNTSETMLNTANVNTAQFGKLFAMPADGQVYAQPLYVPGVTIKGGVHNVVILATENDSVYAYDADSSGAPLWKASLVDAAHGAGTGETALNSFCSDTQPKVGITSTPVIDATSKTVYVEAKSTNGMNYFHRLHALDLLTGNEKTPGPVVIAATVSGTGDGSANGELSFDPSTPAGNSISLHALNRPGLLLLNGTIYLAYASHCDSSPYHGWLFAYDAATFAQKSVYVTTPNGGLGGFWMSGAGVAADASGNIFIPSGNGTFDNTKVPVETGDTILKLGTANQILTLLDYFTPFDQLSLENTDTDLGSGGVVLLPDQPGPFPHILVQAGKEGRIYVVNRDQMTTNNSHYCSGCPNDPEIIEETGRNAAGIGEGMFNTAAYWNNTLYFWGVHDVLKSIPITNGLPDFTHVTESSPQIGLPGAGVSVSSNGTTQGSAIAWAIDGTQFGSPGPGPGPAVLYAYDATNILTMLYSSAQNATRDAAGNAVKFVVPTVTNGKVYVGTSSEVDVYGLIGANPAPNISSINPSSATAGGAAFTFTLAGTGFVTGATVNFGSNPAITPSSVTSTQIVATIPAADIATAGTVNVTVTNPAGGGTSNAQTFTINNPAPTVTSLSPTNATAGGAAFSLTLNGTAFVSTSVVKFNGAAKTTTFVSATQLTAAITAADIATAGTATVIVTNPAPGGGTSGNLSFTINAASAPALTSIAPTSATEGGAAFTFTLTGTGFLSGATVNFGTSPAITPSSVTSTQIVATIPAADIATAGTVNVTVTNPAGGGTSNSQTFAVNNPAPTVTSLSPSSATAGGAAFTLTVNGTGFVSTSVVKFNGAAKTTTFVSATQLTAAITAADIATAGTATVTVTNPAPGGGTSGNLSFAINAASAPTLTSIAPTSATAGGAAFTLTLTGTGLVAGATVNFGTNPAITPSSVTSTQIVATIPAADIATAGTVNVTVTNPAGGGTSNSQTFAVNNPAPTVTSLSPSSATAGGTAFTLTVNGTAFVSTSVVKFNGAARTTTFVNATQLTAAITAADIATAGTATVTVTNRAPGGGTSGNLSFTINAVSGPSLTSIAPTSSTVGGTAFTITITGTGFVSGATVNLGSNPAITPSSVTSTQIVATIPAADIATAGTVNVTVTNPAGGGTSNSQTFAVNNPAPTESSLSPSSTTAGGAAFTLTVNGTGFVSTSVVKFNGAAKTTTFVNGTQLTAAITASDIATAGTANVTVTNPAPGGGTSGNLSFTINAASAPTLTSLAPTSATVGGAAFTLTLTGTGFVAGATVNFGTNPAITPSSVTSTQIVATIPAADIATAGTVNVTVTNPAGGGTSNSQTFAINNPAPTETSLSPSSTTAGGAAFTLTVNGTGFVSTSLVKFNGVAKTTTFVNATQLTTAITAADIATAGTATVIVTNPAPGGTSNAVSFTINNAIPTIGSLSPSSAVAGSAAFTLTVNGVGFVSGATVNFNGTPKATTFVSNTQITAAILASDIATAGTVNVTVTNPAPTLGPSGAQLFTISSPNSPVPTISSLGPTHASGGAAFTLTINGANFEAKSVVNFNGKPETTTFISASQLSAAVPASDVATAGNVNVTVTNPPPGGGTSSASVFTVDGYSLGGPSGASLTSGQPAMIQITATPTANGFTNSISFSVVGLPAGVTASFNPAMLTLNGVAKPTMLTITNGSSAGARRSAGVGGSVRLLQPLLATLFVMIIGWFYLRLQVRATPLMRRYTALALFALILLTGGLLGGCALGVNGSPSANTSQLTVTATSGTLTQTFGITLQVTANIGGR
jgi:hypothetical protein